MMDTVRRVEAATPILLSAQSGDAAQLVPIMDQAGSNREPAPRSSG